MGMACETQNQITISSKQATTKVPKVDEPPQQNSTQYGSAAPLDLDKDIENIHRPSV